MEPPLDPSLEYSDNLNGIQFQTISVTFYKTRVRETVGQSDVWMWEKLVYYGTLKN